MHEVRSPGSARRVRPDPAVAESARQIVGDRWFRDGRADRIAYARDCWQLGILWARRGEVEQHGPDFVVVPGDLEEVVRLVELARASGTPIIPYGAGSGVCGGTMALRGGFVVDAKRFDRLRNLDQENLTMRVGTGAIGMTLETDLNRRGYTMGHYPASLYCSSLGGYLAARSAGQLSTRFGKIEDMCLSLQAVAGSGEVIESAHWKPDLTQLFIGSEGTLGVITEATMRVEPLPALRLVRGFSCASLPAAFQAIRRLLQAGFRPAVVRLYDTFDTLLARGKKHGKSETHKEAPGALVAALTRFASQRAIKPLRPTVEKVANALLRTALGAPLLLNRAVGVLPVGNLLIVSFEGSGRQVAAEAEAAFSLLSESGHDLGEGPGEHWYQRRFAVSYKQSPIMDLGAFVDTMEVSTTWDNLENLYARVKKAVSPHAFIMAHFSHAYREGSSIYFTFAGFAPPGAAIEALYERTWNVALGAVRQAHSNITHHHGAGLLKAGFLSHDHQGGQGLNRLLKQRFDPDGIMNPGKLWDVPQLG
ncbi:MAG: FAD-binding oxidoreductase [Bradymonadales bacterium]|nr:FAD-binding oxidoreductase [Bradymonadales bacterium]